ncbi:hypothetical protein RhiirA1_456243 [Rhizophagus irregularis]|uniref:Uncharacterized protein n=1 Tax=Rhizophagus irregularis TaxID=588596 RepID=A0A2N0S130_9GLOM|nr:hypothetical protein RhiirA1_456243 [Rhizophagus irregularis]
MNNNIDYDKFMRNPPNPVDYNDIFNDSLSDTLFSSSSTSPIPNSFNISSFNINGLKTSGQGSFRIDQISSFFTQQYISFDGVVDTYLSPKQMKFLSKRIKDYSSFHSDLDSTKHGRSSGGVSLFIHNSLATHVQFYESHSSRILSVDLYFKGNVKLRIFVVYIPSINDPILRNTVIDQILRAAKAKLPSVTVGNTYTPKKPKDLKSLTQSYQFLSKVAKSIRLLHKTPTLYFSQFESKWSSYFIRLNNLLSTYSRTFSVPIILPPSLYEGHTDDFVDLLSKLENMTLLLRGLLLLKEKEFQASSIQANINARNDNFTNDISTFIESALSRTRCRIVLDRVFVDHPTNPVLHTSLGTIDREVIDHFQNFVPITSSPSSSIDDLPKR